MNKFKSAAKTMGRGLFRTLWGTAVSATIAMAVYGYVSIPSEGGYVAVVEFIVATATMVVAMNGMYIMGGRSKKGDKK